VSRLFVNGVDATYNSNVYGCVSKAFRTES